MDKSELKILLVDDLEMTRSLMRMELTRQGFRKIEEADEGMTAFSLLRSAFQAGAPYSIIICDWNMPVCDGYQLLQMIRKDKDLAKVPFVMLTAEAEMEAVTKAMQAGATDYLVKPISPEALSKKMLLIIQKVFGQAA